MNREKYTRLEGIPNVGPSLAEDLSLVGVSHPRDLIGRDPYSMYEELCRKTGEQHDPCVIDVFISAVRFMEGEPERPWWAYTSERKQRLAGGDASRPDKALQRTDRRKPLSLVIRIDPGPIPTFSKTGTVSPYHLRPILSINISPNEDHKDAR